VFLLDVFLLVVFLLVSTGRYFPFFGILNIPDIAPSHQQVGSSFLSGIPLLAAAQLLIHSLGPRFDPPIV